MQTKYLRTNVTTHIANILHSRLAASANSLRRPFTELQYLRRNVILRLTINNFPRGNKLYRTQIMAAAAASINFTGIAFHGIFFTGRKHLWHRWCRPLRAGGHVAAAESLNFTRVVSHDEIVFNGRHICGTLRRPRRQKVAKFISPTLLNVQERPRRHFAKMFSTWKTRIIRLPYAEENDMLNGFDTIAERASETDGQNGYINIAHQHKNHV